MLKMNGKMCHRIIRDPLIFNRFQLDGYSVFLFIIMTMMKFKLGQN